MNTIITRTFFINTEFVPIFDAIVGNIDRKEPVTEIMIEDGRTETFEQRTVTFVSRQSELNTMIKFGQMSAKYIMQFIDARERNNFADPVTVIRCDN